MFNPKKYPKYIEVPNGYWECSHSIKYVIVKGDGNENNKSGNRRK